MHVNKKAKSRIRASASRFFPVFFLSSTLFVGAGFLGCHSSSVSAQSGSVSDQGPDPADANMAPEAGDPYAQAARQPGEVQPSTQAQPQQTAPPPASGVQNESIQRAQEYQRTGAQEGAPPPDQQQDQQQDQQPDQQQDQQAQQPEQQQAPVAAQGAYGGAQGNPDDEAGYDELEAQQPPPAMPTYDQPLAPEPNYMWTPGYWGYAPAGYYWVPGVWVASPWPGALWTPGYWGFYGGRYRYHRGYWGRYIGFYGGINYGFGYPGYGFYGGYWRGNSFFYNRAVTRVNVTRITNVYSRTVVVNRTYINNTRVAYNGGRGGIQVRPRPAEISAQRQPRLPPMNTQLQVRQQAAQNRQQFYSANGGRPAMVAAPRPIQADRGIQRPVGQPQVRPGQFQTRPTQPQVRSVQPQQQMRSSPESMQRPTQQAQPRPMPQQAPRPAPMQQPRAMPQQAPRPMPQQVPRPAPMQQPRATPQMAPRPAPMQQPRPAPTPQQAPRSYEGGGNHGGASTAEDTDGNLPQGSHKRPLTSSAPVPGLTSPSAMPSLEGANQISAGA